MMVAGDQARIVGLPTCSSPPTRILDEDPIGDQARLPPDLRSTPLGRPPGGRRSTVPEVERLVTFLRKTQRGFCR